MLREKPVEEVPIITADGDSSVLIPERLDAYVNKYSTKWTAFKEPIETQFWDSELTPNASVPLLERPSQQLIVKASKSFKLFTAQPCGLHPKALQYLSPQALECLSLVFGVSEAYGAYPTAWTQLEVPMIVSGVKRRPIGLYFGLVRVHCRCRKPILSKWDERLRKLVPCFDTHARRRVGDSVWRSQVRAHVASHAGRTTIESNDDVAACFESVRYRPLQFGAQRYGYPMGILRLSLSTYIWPRRIALGGVVASPVFPTGGIVAGSGHADKELKAALAGPIVMISDLCRTTMFRFFVDDVTTSVEDEDEDTAVRKFVDSGVQLRVALGDIGLTLEPHKSTLLSNNPKALERVRKLFGVGVGRTQATVTRLGIDHSCGNPKAVGATPMAFKRVSKALKRAKRLRGIMRSLESATRAKAARKLHMGSVIGVAIHGCDVNAMPSGSRRALMTSQLRARGLYAQGMSADMCYALLGNRNVDHSIMIQPALRYAREWWLTSHPVSKGDVDVLTPCELQAAYTCEAERFSSGVRVTSGAIRTRPIIAALLAFTRAGWHSISPNRWTDLNGDVVSLVDCSEAALRNFLLRDLLTLSWNDCVREKAVADGMPVPDVKYGTRAWLLPAKRLVCSRARGALPWTAKRKLLRMIAGGLVTGQKLNKWGYATTGRCPTCGLLDTVIHRLFHCPYVSEEVRLQAFGRTVLQKAQNDPLFAWTVSRGIFEAPTPGFQKSDAFEFRYRLGVRGEVVSSAVIHSHLEAMLIRDGALDQDFAVFTDGSAYGMQEGELVSAGGGAILFLEGQSQPCAILESPVPRGGMVNCQAGECLGALLGNELANIVGRITGPMRSRVPSSVCIPILRLLLAFSMTLWTTPGGPTWFMLGLPGMWFALATVPTRFPMCGPMVVMRLSLRFLLSVML